MKKLFLLLALLALSGWQTRGQVACTTCPIDALATAVGSGLVVARVNGTAVLPGQSVGACETLFVLGSVAYQGNVLISTPSGPQIVTGSGFFGGRGRIFVNNGNPLSPFNVTPADMATTRVGPIGSGCSDVLVKGFTLLPYTLTPADITAGSVTFTLVYDQGHSLLGDCSLEVQSGSQFVASIVALPSCSIAPASQEVCAGSTATFTVSSTGPPAGAPFTFSWTGPSGFTATGATITVGTAGTYVATITDQFGCQSTCTANLVINPNPVCVVQPATQEVCQGDSATFTVNVSGGTPPFTIAWTGPGAFSAVGPVITATVAGIYTAGILDSKGCTTTCQGVLTVTPCIPVIDVQKTVACYLPGDTCGPFSELATGVRNSSCPAFCFRIGISNAGTVAVTVLNVNDDLLGNISALFADALPLVPGEVITRDIKGVTLCVDTTNTVMALGRSAQGFESVDTDTAAGHVLNINLECDLVITSDIDMDSNPNDSHITLPAGSVDVVVGFTLTLRNSGTSPLTVTNITGLPPLVDCASGAPITVTLPFNLDAGESATLEACTLVSCPGTQFSVQAFGVASDEGNTLCVFDEEGNRVADATDICAANVTCENPITCRQTGGTVLLPGTVDQSCVPVETILYPASTPNGLTIRSVTHGGQMGAPFSNENCGERLNDPCIRGQWQWSRHYEGTANPRDVIEINAHTVNPKGVFDAMSCACLSCCGSDGSIIPAITVGQLCNPGNRICGPEPRRAPANALIWTGLARLTPVDDVNGNRADRSEWIVVLGYVEDRSEPGGFHPKGAEEPADVIALAGWKTGIKVSKKPDFSQVAPAFRRAVAAAACEFLRDLESGAKPIGSLPPREVMGVTADLYDAGAAAHGNLQLHPSTSASCE